MTTSPAHTIRAARRAALLCTLLPAVVAAGPLLRFDARAFDNSVQQALDGKVMGYSYLLMKDGRVVTEGAGGRARNAADGEMAMTTATPQNLGSLFKFITGVTMLHLLERPPANSAGGGGGSFEDRLDAPPALLFPQVWNAAMSAPQMRQVTFRQYLQHKSGFRGGGAPLSNFQRDYDRRKLGVRSYQNVNFSVTGFMVGVYTKRDILQATNSLPANRSAEDKDMYFQLSAGLQMDKVIRSDVLPLAGAQVTASCDGSREYKDSVAYSYVSKDDRKPGIVTSRKAKGKPCLGSGGYYMSVRNFAAFAATALHTDKLLSASTRQLMYSEPMDPDDRLVWSFTASDSWIADKFGMQTIIYSGGDQPYGGGQGAHTAIVRLPEGYVGLVFSNSDDMASSQLAKAAITAFRKGMEQNF